MTSKPRKPGLHHRQCKVLSDRSTYLLALPVSPRDPAASIAAVLNLVHLGELITDASRVATLGAYKGDEVERAQVNLEKLLQAVWLHCYLWTPRAIALLKVQPGRDTQREDRRLRERMK